MIDRDIRCRERLADAMLGVVVDCDVRDTLC